MSTPSAAVAHAVPPSQRLAGFIALLRDHGFRVGAGEQHTMLHATMALGVLHPADIDTAWRAIACGQLREWRLWPELFARYWYPHRLQGTVRVSGQTRAARTLREAVRDLHQRMAEQPAGAPAAPGMPPDLGPASSHEEDAPARPQAMGGASRTDPLHARDAQMWLPSDLVALRQLAHRITAALRPRPTRRWRSDSHGHRLHLRHTLRRSVALGGEPLQAVWQRQRHRPPPLYLLVDVSHSMAAHAPLYLRIARAFALAANAHVYVFHTRLADITPLMARDSARVQEQINAVTAGFGAGTRIASCLHDFVRRHVRARLNRHARVWVFSDGYDTDEPDELTIVLQALKRHGARLTWFHPTRALPASAAIRQARRSIERFIPLASLGDLAAARRLLQ